MSAILAQSAIAESNIQEAATFVLTADGVSANDICDISKLIPEDGTFVESYILTNEEIEALLSHEVETLRRDNFFLKRRSKKSTDAMIADAKKNYGNNYILPKWAEKAIGWSVLIAYPLLLLLDRIGDEFNALVAEMNTGKHVARKKNKPYYRKEGRRRSIR